jgi:CheY-like chemotaxis protein
VKIYLPRAAQAQEWAGAEPLRPVEGGTETILVVEDDAEVRAGAVDVLENLGYRVLQAGDADAALELLAKSAGVDLLFTDVVMPGSIKAAALARRARERFPRIAVLFTSGYTETAAVKNRELDADAQLLSKPYRSDDLARKIRAVLAEAGGQMRVDGKAFVHLPPEGGGPQAPDLIRGEPGGGEAASPHPGS